MGAFSEVTAIHLGTAVAQAILVDLPHNDVSDVIIGNVRQEGPEMNAVRRIGIRAGLLHSAPGQTVGCRDAPGHSESMSIRLSIFRGSNPFFGTHRSNKNSKSSKSIKVRP
jgi:hypothetical protein